MISREDKQYQKLKESKMPKPLKATALAALCVMLAATQSGAIDYSSASERIVLPNRVVLVYRTSGTLTLDGRADVEVLLVGGGGCGGYHGGSGIVIVRYKASPGGMCLVLQ